MTIIVTIPCLNRGGTEMQTLNLVKTLAESGHSVTTLCYFEYDHAVVMEYKQAGSKVELMNLDRSISPFVLISLLRAQFKKRKPDVIHVQYMAPGALPVFAARLAGVKHIFATVHQPWTKDFHGIKAKFLLRISSLLTTMFITVSENAEYSWFGNNMLFDTAMLTTTKRTHFTVHNAIDLERIDKIIGSFNKSEVKEKLGLQDKIVIGAVSRLRHEKGIDLLLDAFSILLPSNNKLRLMIVGSGPDEPMLKAMATRMRIDSKIIFAGSKSWDAAIEMMSLMDIVVCPSRFEGFGLTAAEAMACRKPVVANNTGGLTEVVRNRITGLLIDATETIRLAKAIEMLINNQKLAEKMGKEARKEVETHFSFDLFASKINMLYNKFA